MEKKRLFIAINFPPKVKNQIGEAEEGLKKKYPEIRWEKKENLHLTLKFLGWTPFDSPSAALGTGAQGKELDRILVGMGKAVEGIKPFRFHPTKVGYFLKESLIVWLGAESQEGLFKLVGNLENEMAKIGFPKEKRTSAPHITLGRLRHAHPVAQWRQGAEELEHFPTPQFYKFRVEEIVLMESHLSLQGSTYTPFATQGLI